MALNDALYGRQADAGSLELILMVKAAEGAEELFHVVHVEADAVVTN